MKLKVKFENEICQDFEFVGEKSDWIDLKAARDYGLKQSKIDISVNAVEDVLKKGGLVMLAGTGPGPFLNTSHYVVIRKSSGGKWYTANPGRKELDDTPYDPSYVISMTFAAFGVTK